MLRQVSGGAGVCERLVNLAAMLQSAHALPCATSAADLAR